MNSIFRALTDGRLVEIHSTAKTQAIEAVARIVEASRAQAAPSEFTQKVVYAELAFNTGLGLGLACPHVRAGQEGDLLCAVGWSRAGIDYGSSDGNKVHLIALYEVPDSRRAEFLKERAALIQALMKLGGKPLAGIDDVKELFANLFKEGVDELIK